MTLKAALIRSALICSSMAALLLIVAAVEQGAPLATILWALIPCGVLYLCGE